MNHPTHPEAHRGPDIRYEGVQGSAESGGRGVADGDRLCCGSDDGSLGLRVHDEDRSTTSGRSGLRDEERSSSGSSSGHGESVGGDWFTRLTDAVMEYGHASWW